MAVKFPLKMKDDVQVRNIAELKENFDIEKVVGYFLDGKLQKWLDDRWYVDESEEVSKLDSNDSDLARKLSEIFGVEYIEQEIDTQKIATRNERIAKLKQYTADEEIIANVDSVAFNQEELGDLYDKGIEKIYLCEGKFKIPKSKKDLEYIELGNAHIINKLQQLQAQDTPMDLDGYPELEGMSEKEIRQWAVKYDSNEEENAFGATLSDMLVGDLLGTRAKKRKAAFNWVRKFDNKFN